jgi:pimeloyl-ACP methyl ester carboxylesterase
LDEVTRVVAVPGLGLGPESWRGVLERLDEPSAVRVLPGYGVPTDRGPTPTPAELGARLVAHLDGPAGLLGHSSSCQVVAHAARLAPGLVRWLVLVGPTTDPRAFSWPALAGRWLGTAAHERPGQVPLLARQYRRTTLRSMAATMDAARRDDLRATLSAVECPVVVVRGPHDRISPGDWACAAADAASRGSVLELRAGSHMVPLTHPDLVAAAVAQVIGGSS